MKYLYIVPFFVLSVLVSVSCNRYLSYDPNEYFSDLENKYKNSEIKEIKVDNDLDDGAGIVRFDPNSTISKDVFYLYSMYATLGQTNYYCFRKNKNKTWHIKREVMFYDKPYELENAEIRTNYFILKNGVTFEYNKTSYDFRNKVDLSNYEAIVDIQSIESLISIIENCD